MLTREENKTGPLANGPGARGKLAIISIFFLLLGVAVSSAGCVDATPTPTAPTNFTPPPFTPSFASMAEDFYHLEWTVDGYPGQRRPDGSFWEHPIFPTYVLADWISQYNKHPSAELEAAIAHIARVAISRMDEHEGALVFWYEPGGGARLTSLHFSALTQGYYAIRLWQAGTILEDPAIHEAAAKSFRALLVPVDKNGVLDADYSVAEVPQQPNSYILNGWLSALSSAWTYYELSGDEEARDLVLRSSERLAALLPLFDAPVVANSRYGLTGFVFLRVTGDIQNPKQVAGNDTFPLPYERAGPRWVPHQRSDRLNLVLSLAGDNHVVADASSVTRVQIEVGEYTPKNSAPVHNQWVDLEWTLEDGQLDVEIPRDVVEAAVYPTNFVKVIDGENTNVYHPIHVRRLNELEAATGIETLGTWADRWADAMCLWGEMPMYDGLWTRRIDTAAHVSVEDACWEEAAP